MSDSPTAPTMPRDPEDHERQLVGTILVGRYVVLDKLGAGGMGVVYSAFDLKLERKIAVKLLASASAQPGRLRLEREAQAMARLSHPNVLPVHDVGMHGEDVFVAMDFVDGSTLSQWLRGGPPEARRDWREVLRKFLDAGRGLAAAHAAGLVHRDFKPDNVLVRADGHVFVTDFGLARAAGGTEITGDTPISPLHTSLTRTGAVLGTPAYMSPEQHRGEAADARSDQFSFCTALYEGLYGQPPFRPERKDELGLIAAIALEVEQGRVQPTPRSEVPARVQRAVLRGLRASAAERFPSMPALLAELVPEPRGNRGAWLVAGALALGVSALVWRGLSGEPPCPDARARLSGVWDGEARRAAERAFALTGKRNAADAFARAASALDAYADAWARSRGDACEATAVRHEQSPALLDLRMGCLDRRRAALASLSAELGRADGAVVGRAVQAALDLPPVAACDDAEALMAATPPPGDPVVRARVEALRAQFDGLWALFRIGKFDVARRAAVPLVELAKAMPYPPIRSEALEMLAAFHIPSGEGKQAEALLREALEAAAESGDRARMASVEVGLILIVGYRQGRTAEALAMVPLADAAVRQVKDDGTLRFRLLYHVAQVHHAAGDYPVALAAYEAAKAFRVPQVGADAWQIGQVENGIANVLIEQGKNAEGEQHLLRALAIIEKNLGRGHPHYGLLLGNLGNAVFNQKRNREAMDYYRRSVAVLEQVLDPEDPSMLNALGNLAMILDVTGAYEEAERRYREVISVRARVLGPDNELVGSARFNYSAFLSGVGRHVEAEAEARQSLAIYEKAMGPDHPQVAYPLLALAQALLDRGAPAEALALAQRARVLREKTAVPGSAAVATPWAAIGEAQAAMGRSAEAVPLLEKALEILEHDPGAEVAPAQVRFALARALWPRDRVRARALAEKARDEVRAEAPAGAYRLGQIEKWLAGR